jgi:hypothetical protein
LASVAESPPTIASNAASKFETGELLRASVSMCLTKLKVLCELLVLLEIGTAWERKGVGHTNFDRQNVSPSSLMVFGRSSDVSTHRVRQTGPAVTEVFVSASFRNVYYHNALRWPPNPIQAREVALHGGYPQVLRNPRTKEVDFPFQWFATRVNDANNERISLHPDVPNTHWPGHEGEEINDRFHGQSGGPVYRVIDANPDSFRVECVFGSLLVEPREKGDVELSLCNFVRGIE